MNNPLNNSLIRFMAGVYVVCAVSHYGCGEKKPPVEKSVLENIVESERDEKQKLPFKKEISFTGNKLEIHAYNSFAKEKVTIETGPRHDGNYVELRLEKDDTYVRIWKSGDGEYIQVDLINKDGKKVSMISRTGEGNLANCGSGDNLVRLDFSEEEKVEMYTKAEQKFGFYYDMFKDEIENAEYELSCQRNSVKKEFKKMLD